MKRISDSTLEFDLTLLASFLVRVHQTSVLWLYIRCLLFEAVQNLAYIQTVGLVRVALFLLLLFFLPFISLLLNLTLFGLVKLPYEHLQNHLIIIR